MRGLTLKAPSSNIPTHRSKRRRGQRRNKRRHEDSPDLEIPLTIAEEASGDDDELLEKRSRGEKISSDGMILLLSFSLLSFYEDFVLIHRFLSFGRR